MRIDRLGRETQAFPRSDSRVSAERRLRFYPRHRAGSKKSPVSQLLQGASDDDVAGCNRALRNALQRRMSLLKFEFRYGGADPDFFRYKRCRSRTRAVASGEQHGTLLPAHWVYAQLSCLARPLLPWP